MTPDLRQSIVMSRTGDFNHIMRTTLLVFLGISAVLYFGEGGFSLPLLVLTITAAAYGILGGGAALDDINALKGDMSSEFSETSYGAGVMARDVVTLKLLASALIGVTALALTLALIF